MQISLVGDVMLGRLVNEHLQDAAPPSVWGDVRPVLAQAGVRFANLECVIADGGSPWPGKAFHFRSDAKNVACLEAAGIGVVSLANNHTLDYGPGALREMLLLLDAHRILHAGAGADLAAAQEPAIVRTEGTAVAVIAFTDNEPGWAATEASPGIFYAPTVLADGRVRRLLALVRGARDDAEFLMVSAHWGANWGAGVPRDHQALAHALVEAGADLVFGHSAHIFRGVEVYRGRPVIYSAGDFLDDYAIDPRERNDQSFVFLVEAHARGHAMVPTSVRLYPTVIEGFRVRRARAEARAIAARVGRLSAELGTRAHWLESEQCLEILCGQAAEAG